MVYIKKEVSLWLLGLWGTRRSRYFGMLLLVCAAGVCWLLLASEQTSHTSVDKPVAAPLFRLGVVDQEKDSYTELLLRYFEESDAFSSYIGIEVGEESEIQRRFEEGDLDGWLLLPEGFISGMVTIEHVPLVVTLSLADTTKAVLLQNVFQVYGYYVAAVEGGCMTLYRQMETAGAKEEQLERANWQISLDLILAALGREDFFSYEAQSDSQTVPLPVYYGFAFLGLLPFLVAIRGGVILLEEKKRGVTARIRLIPGALGRWFGSKLLLYGGTSFLIAVLAGAFLKRGLGREGSLTGLLSALGLCMGMVLAMLVLALLAEERRGYLLLAGMLVLLLAMSGGCFLPVDFLPEKLAEAAEWIPNRLLSVALMGN